jgi:uncharacterized protein YhaN
MRLTSMTLHRYGNYDAERISFSPAKGTVNLLLAPNSAGKSVFRGAFGDLLFGIHNQTPMDFRFGYSGMRVTAGIIQPDDSETTFSRRKTRGNAVIGPDDLAIDPGFLHGILGGRDRKLLERLFVLDTEALRRGGADLLESGGDVASALLAAAGGIRQARALKQMLEKKRDDLAPERRTASRPFYQALDQFLEARRRIGAETLRPEARFRQQQELDELEDRRRTQNLAAEAASAETARLQRIRRVRGWLKQWTDAAAWLEMNLAAPRLGPDTRKALELVRLDIATRQEAARLARESLENAEQHADDVIVNSGLLAQTQHIKHLVDEAGEARSARDDLPGVRGEYDFCLARTRELMRHLGSDLPPERAAEALPTRALLARTRQRIKDHAEIAAAAQTASSRIAARTNDLAEVERQLAELPPAQDLRRLEVLIEEIRGDGDPASRRLEAERSLAEAEAALDAALARVPVWSGSAEALASLIPPGVDVWRRLDADMFAKRAEIATAAERLDDETGTLEQAKNDLSALMRGGTVPDDDTLQRARSRRDVGWKLIYRRAFTPDPPSAAEENVFAADVPLPLAFERAIAEADAIVDRRAANSELLGLVEAARFAVAEAQRRISAARQRLRLAEEALDQTKRAWAQLCGSVAHGHDSALADIQTFLNARNQVIDDLRRRALAAQSLGSLGRRQQEWSNALAAALAEAPSDLPFLLGLSDRLLSQARQQRQARLGLDTLRNQAAKEVRDSIAAQAEAAENLRAWERSWRAVLAELGRPETEEAGETEAVLQTIGEIDKEHIKTSVLLERMTGMDARIGRFTASVHDLPRNLPGLILAADPFDAVRDLDRLLDVEREQDQRHRVLHESREKARDAASIADQELTAAQARLHAILSVIGADTIDAADQRLALSDQRAAVEARHAEAEAELRQAGDGYSVQELLTEIQGTSADEDAAQIAAASLAHKQANEAAQQAAEAASRLRQSMELAAEATNIHAAAADQQAAIASVSRTLDEALVYHTASLLLSRALDAVEQSGGSVMLRRLSVIFQELTCGVYTNVASDPSDDGKAELVMIQRDFPEERQRIGQLSEGTRDQLFLALRVAAIEDHLSSAEPIPFIGDDILQTFDDDRTLATLRVLADLSHHTQVIVLTHHRHVLELAASLPVGMSFQCRREPLATTA